MICPVCFGRKYDFKKDGNSGYFVECKNCHGTGIVEPQTNEKWLQTCTTEQLAEWLNNKIIICAVCDQQKSCGYFINETFHLCPYHEGKNKSWEMWLKQPHSEVGK